MLLQNGRNLIEMFQNSSLNFFQNGVQTFDARSYLGMSNITGNVPSFTNCSENAMRGIFSGMIRNASEIIGDGSLYFQISGSNQNITKTSYTLDNLYTANNEYTDSGSMLKLLRSDDNTILRASTIITNRTGNELPIKAFGLYCCIVCGGMLSNLKNEYFLLVAEILNDELVLNVGQSGIIALEIKI